MWCTSCHVAFDWRTLKIVTGVVHNPHYYEYQRSINGGVAPRVPGDIPGNGCENNLTSLGQCIQRWRSNLVERSSCDKLRAIHRMTTHIQYHEIPILPTEYIPRENEDVRRKFLKNLIDETRLKWFLQKREKANSKKREIRQLYEMFVACCRDFIHQSIRPGTKNNDVQEVLDQFVGLCLYFDENAKKISATYGGVVPQIEINREFEKDGQDGGTSWCNLISRYI